MIKSSQHPRNNNYNSLSEVIKPQETIISSAENQNLQTRSVALFTLDADVISLVWSILFGIVNIQASVLTM